MANELLGIYLNDHLAGATGGVQLVRRTARNHRGHPSGAALARLAREVAEDRKALLGLMRALGVPRRGYKVVAGWLGERAGRLKANGRLRERSPLSSVVELEGIRLGIEGKAAVWRSLRLLAGDYRIDPERLDELLRRADAQIDEVEALRLRAVKDCFSGDS
jgi:hypothetical protein